jgi:hypothetical protein
MAVRQDCKHPLVSLQYPNIVLIFMGDTQRLGQVIGGCRVAVLSGNDLRPKPVDKELVKPVDRKAAALIA